MNPGSRHLPAARPRRPAPSRRGLTLLEVLLAVVMLVMLTVSITTAISSIAAMESRSRKRTAACELANRLIIQYLDDEEKLPNESLPLDYGKDRYFWKKKDWTVRMTINSKQESSSPSLQGLSRYKMVRVTVYEADESGEYPQAGDPLVRIERIFDPATARNPDTIAKLDENGIRKIINGLIGVPAGDGK